MSYFPHPILDPALYHQVEAMAKDYHGVLYQYALQQSRPTNYDYSPSYFGQAGSTEVVLSVPEQDQKESSEAEYFDAMNNQEEETSSNALAMEEETDNTVRNLVVGSLLLGVLAVIVGGAAIVHHNREKQRESEAAIEQSPDSELVEEQGEPTDHLDDEPLEGGEPTDQQSDDRPFLSDSD